MSLAGLAFFIRIEKNSPAGPPPRQTMRIGISTSGEVPTLFLFYISSINRVNPEPGRIAMTMRHRISAAAGCTAF